MKEYYLGIDCGSVSLKGVIIDEKGQIIKYYYTKNKGLIQTIKEVLNNLKINLKISAVGVTGSGKEFISKLIGADITESEIIAHYIATINKYPDVKTIFDIGGEDCKLLQVDNKKLISFSMNLDCGGGTGAMIESLANRMGVNIDEVGDIALESKMKVFIPSKCGIFAQSAVVSKLNKGVKKEDILMGICRGLIGNYFAMLAKGKNLESPYVFQGATAKNKALIKCFEDELNSKIIIPEYPELMGAYGIALLAKEQFKGKTNFLGFDNMNEEFTTETHYGKGCNNECEITTIYNNNKKVGIIGNRCERCINGSK